MLPQVRQKGQQGQSQNAEIIAFDVLHQLNSQTFKLIAADRRENRVGCGCNVTINEIIGQCPHREVGCLAMAGDGLVVAEDFIRSVEGVGLSTQALQVLLGLLTTFRFVENLAVELKSLIDANDYVIGVFRDESCGLGICECYCECFRF